MIQWVPGITLDEAEKQCILQAFRFYRGNKTQSSIALGISVRTLEHKLERYEGENAKHQDRERADKIDRERQLARFRGQPDPHPEEKAEASSGLAGPSTGMRVEPTEETSTEQPMPVPEREEIQKVLSRPTAPRYRQKAGR